MQIVKGNRYSLSYSAIEDGTTKRRPTTARTSAESVVLTPPKRERAAATARDDRRNMSILAWMIRRHLDNVSRFTPHFRVNGDSPEVAAVNDIVAKLLAWHGRKTNFDALKRHGRNEWMRMFEACKVLSGDAAGLKVKGGRLQGIEGDRIAKAGGLDSNGKPAPKDVNDDGLQLNSDNSRKAFCLCRRVDKSLQFERMVPASDMVFDGYWPERFDSNRGVSPLLTALNEAADVRETWEWLVLKAKASALFGLAFTRTGSDDMMPTSGEDPDAAPTSEASAYTQQLAAAVKSRGIISLDLDPGDDVKEIQSATPNPTIVPFTRELIRSVLLALDIPFTFYDSLTASFSARIADRNEYEESCEWKREKNADILSEIYGDWLLPMWEKANVMGLGKALKKAGLEVEEIAAELQWMPAGRAWLDRSGEMSGHILAIASGIESIPEVCSMYGKDAYKVSQEQADYLKRAGQPLLYANGGQVAVQEIMKSMLDAEDQKSVDDTAQTDEPSADGVEQWL
jgi:capsid protein